MCFALCPDDGAPRLIRFGQLPDENVVAAWDKEKNLLVIDQVLFNELSAANQERVLRTTAPFIVLDYRVGPELHFGEHPAPMNPFARAS